MGKFAATGNSDRGNYPRQSPVRTGSMACARLSARM